MKSSWNRRALVVLLLESAFAATAGAETVSLAARKNNTIYSESENTNGGGQYFFVGNTHDSRHPHRRSIISFDVAGSIPGGSTIERVSLTLYLSRTQSDPITVYLQRCLAPWGEGTVVGSSITGAEGQGGPAQPGDATWTYNAFVTSRWSTPGGDYASTPSGSTNVSNEIGFKVWNSTPVMVSDVQSWLDSPQANYGWMLIADRETEGITSAKGFASRRNQVSSDRPLLQIDYTPPGVTDGGADGGEPDAGVTDAGVGAGQDSGQDPGTGSPNAGPSRMSSGCQIAPGSFLAMVGAALLALSRSRRRGRTTLESRK